jgi:hypothetical protein
MSRDPNTALWQGTWAAVRGAAGGGWRVVPPGGRMMMRAKPRLVAATSKVVGRCGPLPAAASGCGARAVGHRGGGREADLSYGAGEFAAVAVTQSSVFAFAIFGFPW